MQPSTIFKLETPYSDKILTQTPCLFQCPSISITEVSWMKDTCCYVHNNQQTAVSLISESDFAPETPSHFYLSIIIIILLFPLFFCSLFDTIPSAFGTRFHLIRFISSILTTLCSIPFNRCRLFSPSLLFIPQIYSHLQSLLCFGHIATHIQSVTLSHRYLLLFLALLVSNQRFHSPWRRCQPPVHWERFCHAC